MNKYRNIKCKCLLGHSHDSKKEAEYCLVLESMRREGEIEGYEQQPAFILQEGFTDSSEKKQREIKYIADFLVFHSNGKKEVIDVKGFKTETFKIKWKMLLYKYKNEKNYIFTIY